MRFLIAFTLVSMLLADERGDNAGGEGCRKRDVAPWARRASFGPPSPFSELPDPFAYVIPIGMQIFVGIPGIGLRRYRCVGPTPHWIEFGQVAK